MIAACAEMVWDVLAEKLDTEDEVFDTLVLYAVDRCLGVIPEDVGVAEWLAEVDSGFTAAVAGADLARYCRACGYKGGLEVLLQKAVLMGRVGLGEGVEGGAD